jgi:hypothetical protein
VTGVVAGAVAMPQTPSEWLLTRFDRMVRRAYGPQGDARRIRYDRGSNFDRQIVDVIDDHPGAECYPDRWNEGGDCIHWSGAASWLQPELGDELDDDFGGDGELTLEEIA